MIRYVQDKATGQYKKPLYRYFTFYIAILLLSSIFIHFVNNVFKNSVFSTISITFFVIALLFVVYKLYVVVIGVKKYGFLRYFQMLRIVKKIKMNLISTMRVDVMKSTKFINVPNVDIDIINNEQEKFIVMVERLANMNDVEQLKHDVSVSFNGKFKDYAVTDSYIQDDYSAFVFILENVNISKRLIPKKVDELVTDDPYKIKIQKGLIWDMNSAAHCLVSGKTGSSKSTFLFSVILSCLYHGVDVNIIDPKRSMNFDFLNVVHDSEESLSMIAKIVEIMEEREKQVSDHCRTLGKIGLTAKDLNLKPIMLVIDELSALVASLDNNQKKVFDSYLVRLVQKGRSSGCIVVCALQNANSETLKVAIRNQFGLRVLLGNSSREDVQFIFGSNNATVKNSRELYVGYYYLDGQTNEPQKLYVTDLYKYSLNATDVFRDVFEKGRIFEKNRIDVSRFVPSAT